MSGRMFYKLNPARLQFYQKVPQMVLLIILISWNGKKHHFNYSLSKTVNFKLQYKMPPFSPSVASHQANKAQPQKNPHNKEPGMSGDIFEYVNVTQMLSTLISCHLQVQSSLCVTLLEENSFREGAGGWHCCGCRDGNVNHHILAFALIAF